MWVGILRTIDQNRYEKFQSCRVHTQPFRPVKCLDDSSPIQRDMLYELVSCGLIRTSQKLTKLLKALTNAPTSHSVPPSAASRARLVIISTT